MGNLFTRLFEAIGNIIRAFLNIGIRLKYVILVLVLFCGAAIGITYNTMLKNVGGKENYEEAMRYILIKDICEDKFIDEVDRHTMGDSAAAAMVAGLGDRWSYFMTADEYRSYQLYSANEYSDIGMTIVKNDSGMFQVMSVNVGTPAAFAGLSSGMIINAVDGSDVSGMDIDAVRILIRSKTNSKFTLTVNGSTQLTVDCTSTYISPVSYRFEKTLAGYVQIKSFEAGSGADAIAAIEDLLYKGAVALCIDVRGNSGGLASEVAQLLDYLLPNGVLFIEIDKDGKQVVTESEGMCIQLPMVVLVNSETYSEAELFAAVIQSYSWGQILGEPTMGMTRSQETIELEDGSAIRLSTKSYLTKNGVDICRNGGVVPEIILYNSDPDATGTTEGTLGESDGTGTFISDEQLIAALKLLS